MKKLVVSLFSLGTLVFTACSSQTSTKVSGDYTAFIQGNDWRESLSRITLRLDKEVDYQTISADDFSITETKDAFDYMKPEKGLSEVSDKRKVIKAYASNEAGKKVKKNTKYVTLELENKPNKGTYFVPSPETTLSQYPEKYELDVKLSDKSNMAAGGVPIKIMKIETKAASLTTSADMFKLSNFKATDGTKYNYAYYEPEKKSDTLVVWLHGLGEGGVKNTDPYITLLGNEVTSLSGKEFQSTIGSANILVPQSPSFWMDKTGKDGLVGGKIVSDGTSVYTESLYELITSYKEQVGAKKVIIVGASNGGFMGVVLAKTYGSEFDGYVLICEAMEDRFLTDDDINTLKNLPLYFIYSNDDPLVTPDTYEKPTIERLKAAGASNLKTFVSDSVINKNGEILDEDGNPYNFGGHSAWVYFFNNESNSDDGSTTVWDWMRKIAID